jgi:hypothetical protein
MRSMSGSKDTVLERVKVREVAGVFRSRDALDAAVDELMLAGIDRADIDLMADFKAVREKLGGVYIAVEELPDVPQAPREAFFAREDVVVPLTHAVGMLAFIGVSVAAALSIAASGGALALAALGAGGAGLTALLARTLGSGQARELEAQLSAGGLVLWVRARSPEREEKIRRILVAHGADSVRVHEIEIEKRLEDLPLSSLLVDPLPAKS